MKNRILRGIDQRKPIGDVAPWASDLVSRISERSKQLRRTFAAACAGKEKLISTGDPAGLLPLPDSPLSNVSRPIEILLGGPSASTTVSPCRHAGSPLISTVGRPSTTTPAPCGGAGIWLVHSTVSAPPAAPAIVDAMLVAALALVASSAVLAAAFDVPVAARVTASAVLMAASDTAFAAWIAAAAAAGTPRHANLPPMITFKLPGPGVNTGGPGWLTGSPTLAAGRPTRKLYPSRSTPSAAASRLQP